MIKDKVIQSLITSFLLIWGIFTAEKLLFSGNMPLWLFFLLTMVGVPILSNAITFYFDKDGNRR